MHAKIYMTKPHTITEEIYKIIQKDTQCRISDCDGCKEMTKEIIDIIEQALHRKDEEWKKKVRGLKKIGVRKLSGSGDKYDYSTNMAKWYNSGIEAAQDELNKKLDELLK